MKKNSYIPLIVAISIIIGMAVGYFVLSKAQNSNANLYSKANKINYILDLINKEYVDNINGDSLTDDAIRALLTELDPHSVYMTADEVKKENESLNGNFDGIGVQFRIVDDTIAVVRTISGGPSEKVGILAGDRIVKVDGRQPKNITNDTVVRLLKGKRGSKVKLGIKRKGINHLIDYVVT